MIETTTVANRKTLKDVGDLVQAVTPNGVEHYRKACEVIPGGTTRKRFFWPLPLFIDHAEGPYLYDIDARRYVDCNLGFGPLILGHRHPAVMQAIRGQLDYGVMYGCPVTAEEALARKFVEHVPGAERVCFLNSGTEAAWAAARVARAATGRTKLAKFEGGWHGWHDFGVVSYFNPKGPPEAAEAVPESLGVPSAVLGEMVILPYNDRRCLDRIKKEADDLACVFIEAVQGGCGSIPIDRELLHDLRDLTKKLGIVLIIDEVITGFRLGASGASGYYEVTPDMVMLGKVIGGGCPVGAIAGRAELLGLIEPEGDVPQIVMFGTFSANPLTLAAGNAQLEVLLSDDKYYQQIDELGERMRSGIESVFSELEVDAHVTGVGSMWGYHFVPKAPRNRREQEGKNVTGASAFGAYLRNEGVFLTSPPHLGFVSTAHSVEDVDFAIEAHRRAMERTKEEGFM